MRAFLLLLTAAACFAQTPGNWTQISPLSSPGARESSGFAYDSTHGRVILSGGQSEQVRVCPGDCFNDTWIWNGTAWAQQPAQAGMPSLWNPDMVYDSARGQLVSPNGAGNTWAWDGAIWSQESPQNNFAPRSSYEIAYDAARGQVVLFGGQNGSLVNGTLVLQEFSDTWVWDGANWTQKFPQTSPSARDSYTMAYDAAHGQVVLFGGTPTYLGAMLDDTWVWDGSNWTQMFPVISPPGRVDASMAFDAAHGQLIMFGGAVNQGFTGSLLNDTWAWDGSSWTRLFPQNMPPARDANGFAYDASHGNIVMYGGCCDSNGNAFGDMWLWDGGSATTTPTIANVISASGFGGLAAISPGSWIEVYGFDLAPATRTWTGADFTGNNAPTALNGVQVTIGGQKAYVAYIGANPGQVNVQVPSNVPTGGIQPVVVVNNGVSSQPFQIMVDAAEPGLLAVPSFDISGIQYPVAFFGDGNYVLPTGAIAGVTSRPAKPNETIVLYGTGFGPVTPSQPAGQISTVASQLTEPFQVKIGGVTAPFNYDGLTQSLVGLYQFNVVVPAIADNPAAPLTFTLNGVPDTQTLYIPVHQ